MAVVVAPAHILENHLRELLGYRLVTNTLRQRDQMALAMWEPPKKPKPPQRNRRLRRLKVNRQCPQMFPLVDNLLLLRTGIQGTLTAFLHALRHLRPTIDVGSGVVRRPLGIASHVCRGLGPSQSTVTLDRSTMSLMIGHASTSLHRCERCD